MVYRNSKPRGSYNFRLGSNPKQATAGRSRDVRSGGGLSKQSWFEHPLEMRRAAGSRPVGFSFPFFPFSIWPI
jgi:hypothetical protein